jgi:O-antigen ligase
MPTFEKTKPPKPASRPDVIVAWAVLGLFAVVCLITTINSNDSTLLKPYVLFIGTAVLLSYIVYLVLNQRKTEFTVSIIHYLLAAYIFAGILSVFRAQNLNLSIEALAIQICYAMTFFIAFEYFSQSSIREQAVTVLLSLTTIVCAAAIIIARFPALLSLTPLSTQREYLSTFGNTTYFAGYLVLTLPIAATAMITGTGGTKKFFGAAALLVVIAYLLILTESRIAWAGAIVSGILFITVNYSKPRTRWIVWGIVLAGGVIVYFLFPEIIQRRLTTVFTKSPESTLTRRLFFYEGALRAFFASPFIGNGIGNFTMFLARFRSPDYWIYKSEDLVPHAHNEYLEILSETGIIGLALFCAILVLYFRNIGKSIKGRSGTNRTIMAGFFCGITGVLIDNLASLNLRTIPVGMGFWMVMALSLRQGELAVKSFSIHPPLWLRRLRYLPFLGLGIFLLWIFPIVADRYAADHSFFQGIQADYSGDSRASIEKFEDAVHHSPHDAKARFYLAAAFMKTNQPREAVDQASIVLSEYPYYPKTRVIRAVSAFALGDTVTAVNDITAELSIETTPLTLYYASYFAFTMNKPVLEYAYTTELIENSLRGLNPDYVPRAIERFSAVGRKIHYESVCESTLARLRITFYNNPTVLVAIVEGYGVLGRYDKAKETLDGALAIDQLDGVTKNKLLELSEKLALIKNPR